MIRIADGPARPTPPRTADLLGAALNFIRSAAKVADLLDGDARRLFLRAAEAAVETVKQELRHR